MPAGTSTGPAPSLQRQESPHDSSSVPVSSHGHQPRAGGSGASPDHNPELSRGSRAFSFEWRIKPSSLARLCSGSETLDHELLASAREMAKCLLLRDAEKSRNAPLYICDSSDSWFKSAFDEDTLRCRLDFVLPLSTWSRSSPILSRPLPRLLDLHHAFSLSSLPLLDEQRRCRSSADRYRALFEKDLALLLSRDPAPPTIKIGCAAFLKEGDVSKTLMRKHVWSNRYSQGLLIVELTGPEVSAQHRLKQSRTLLIELINKVVRVQGLNSPGLRPPPASLPKKPITTTTAGPVPPRSVQSQPQRSSAPTSLRGPGALQSTKENTVNDGPSQTPSLGSSEALHTPSDVEANTRAVGSSSRDSRVLSAQGHERMSSFQTALRLSASVGNAAASSELPAAPPHLNAGSVDGTREQRQAISTRQHALVRSASDAGLHEQHSESEDDRIRPSQRGTREPSPVQRAVWAPKKRIRTQQPARPLTARLSQARPLRKYAFDHRLADNPLHRSLHVIDDYYYSLTKRGDILRVLSPHSQVSRTHRTYTVHEAVKVPRDIGAVVYADSAKVMICGFDQGDRDAGGIALADPFWEAPFPSLEGTPFVPLPQSERPATKQSLSAVSALSLVGTPSRERLSFIAGRKDHRMCLWSVQGYDVATISAQSCWFGQQAHTNVISGLSKAGTTLQSASLDRSIASFAMTEADAPAFTKKSMEIAPVTGLTVLPGHESIFSAEFAASAQQICLYDTRAMALRPSVPATAVTTLTFEDTSRPSLLTSGAFSPDGRCYGAAVGQRYHLWDPRFPARPILSQQPRLDTTSLLRLVWRNNKEISLLDRHSIYLLPDVLLADSSESHASIPN